MSSSKDYGAGYVSQEFLLCPLSDMQSVSGTRLVDSVRSNKKSEVSCTGDTSSPTCGMMEEVLDSGNLLKICQGKKYQDDSVEGVGLKFIRNLEQTYAFASKHGLSTIEGRLQVQVLPKRYRVFPNGKRSLTLDNLTTVYALGKDPEMYLYPNSAKTRLRSGVVSYAENPWVVAHEVGHVLFNDKTEFDRFSYRLMSGSNSRSLRHQMITGEIGARQVGPLLYGSVVSEAWSDLFASVVVGKKSVRKFLKNVPCMHRTRDVTDSRLVDRSTKVLSVERVKIFTANTSIGGPDCNVPWFQDPHIIASILAYSFYQVMLREGITGSNEQMAVLGRWLVKIRARMQGSSLSLRNLLMDGLESLQKNQLKPASCKVLRSSLPTEATAFKAFGC